MGAENNAGMEGKPPGDVQAVAIMMKSWLEHVVCDAGTGVDSGVGLDCADLWFTVGGHPVFLTMRLTKGAGHGC